MALLVWKLRDEIADALEEPHSPTIETNSFGEQLPPSKNPYQKVIHQIQGG
jgi:hypothetical protein